MVVSTDISYGTHVCMKNSPMYQPGAIGFTIANGFPKVSQLLLAAWNLDSTYRFKILPAGSLHTGESVDKCESNGNASASGSSKSNHKETADHLDMLPPPSPASSTCSDTGSITTSHKREKCMTPRSDGETGSMTPHRQRHWPRHLIRRRY
ncbi:E3 ubiquitin-protein ligase hyd-like [Neodiprion virginianus]|uniref:E3 ubiquitin-protein ligase hyd-like n=1 Tax=Neodiprion virginianus TaxID=2961670 RepID=UPI001EE6CB3A|nr:E3 ubiquitin-protein ligase hyd-like [Neodiprion virginianus]